MANYYDIAIDDTGKMLVENGDWKIVPSDNTDAGLIMRSNTGNWTQSPVVFVNLISYVNGPFDVKRRNKLLRVIKEQMQLDGLTVLKLDIPSVSAIKLQVERR